MVAGVVAVGHSRDPEIVSCSVAVAQAASYVFLYHKLLV